jgi:hypothetical protein
VSKPTEKSLERAREFVSERCCRTAHDDCGSAKAFCVECTPGAEVVPLAQLLDEVREEATPKWQPIETAPRDGTRLLLWLPEWKRSEIGSWLSCSRMLGWWSVQAKPVAPTLWQPLPDSPKEDNRG